MAAPGVTFQEGLHYGLLFTGAGMLALGVVGLWFAQKGEMRAGLFLTAVSIPFLFLGFLLMMLASRRIAET